MSLWLSGSGHAFLCFYQSWDDLLGDPAHWPDERSRSCSLTYILCFFLHNVCSIQLQIYPRKTCRCLVKVVKMWYCHNLVTYFLDGHEFNRSWRGKCGLTSSEPKLQYWLDVEGASVLNTRYICQNIPRHVLEGTYGINIIRPREDEDPDRHPTSEELLMAYGCKTTRHLNQWRIGQNICPVCMWEWSTDHRVYSHWLSVISFWPLCVFQCTFSSWYRVVC